MRKSKGMSKGGARMMRARGGKMMAKGMRKGGTKMMRARGGKMAKSYAKGGTKMMRAMGGKMAKGYAKGGTKMMRARGGKMAKGMAVGGILAGSRAAVKGVTALRAAAKKLGYGLTKVKTPKPTKMKKKKPGYGQGFATGAAYTGAATVGLPAYVESKRKKGKEPFPMLTSKKKQFETAFKAARKSGKKTFTFKGKKYTTKLKK